MDEDFSRPTSSVPPLSKTSSMLDGEVLELVWKNGQVVIQSKNHKSRTESPPSTIAEKITNRDSRPLNKDEEMQVFMQEDEMISLLNYPLVDDSTLENSFCHDFLYPSQLQSIDQNAGDSSQVRTSHSMEFRQPIPLTRRTEPETETETEPETEANSFGLFSKHTGRVESGSSNSKSVVRESPVVVSFDTTWLTPESTASELQRTAVADASSGDLACRIMSGGRLAATSSDNVGRLINITGGETEPAIQKMTSLEDRKRKGKETDDSDYHHRSTDVEFESTDAKRQGLGSTSTKRSRAADVHNLSERRRRDRINERMKALQELIPQCSKTDKASMLDEAIEYLKSLQLQVQMMSKGGGMVPMMCPGVQQVMPPMGMGFGMGMETSVNRPMMPYPNLLAGSTFPRPSGAAQLGQPFTFPAFHMAHVPNTAPSIIQGTSQSDHMHNSSEMQNIYQSRVSSSLDGYQQFLGSQQMHVPVALSQPSAQIQPAAALRSHNQHTSRGLESIGNHEPGSPTMDPC